MWADSSGPKEARGTQLCIMFRCLAAVQWWENGFLVSYMNFAVLERVCGGLVSLFLASADVGPSLRTGANTDVTWYPRLLSLVFDAFLTSLI